MSLQEPVNRQQHDFHERMQATIREMNDLAEKRRRQLCDDHDCAGTTSAVPASKLLRVTVPKSVRLEIFELTSGEWIQETLVVSVVSFLGMFG